MSLVKASGLSETELFQELLLLLYARAKLSAGKASRFLGLNQLQFQALLAKHDLYLNDEVEDLHADISVL